jgi:HAD superfamily hydrolase (TIGR01509 family)
MKAVIFDMDGLLIDSEPLWDKSDRYFLERKGFIYTPQLRARMLGTGQREGMELLKKEFALPETIDELIKERKEVFYNIFFKNIKLMKGVLEFIKSLKSKNLQMAVATGGHGAEKVKDILRSFNLDQYFSVIVSSDQVNRGKPYPDVYLFTAKLLSLEPDQCLVLEDTVNGVMAGKRAGMQVFGVNEDEKAKENLIKAGADKVFPNLLEINL